MIFDVRQSEIFKAVELNNYLPRWILKWFRTGFLAVGSLFLLFYLFSFFASVETIIWGFNRLSLAGGALVFFPLGLAIVFFEIYRESHLKRPPIVNFENLAELLDFDAAIAMARATKISAAMNETAVSINALLLSLLEDDNLRMIFIRLGISTVDLAKQLQISLGMTVGMSLKILLPRGYMSLSEELSNLLVDANNSRITQVASKIAITDLLTALFDYSTILGQILAEKELSKDDLVNLGHWYKKSFEFFEKSKRFWELDNLLRKKPIGTSWIYGYPWVLNNFTLDITARYGSDFSGRTTIGRGKVVEHMEEILSRAGENNVLLIGEAGIGKKTIIEEFARMIATGKALPALNYKRVLEFNIPLVVASSKEPMQVQQTFISVLDEAVKAGNIILVINNLHDFIGSSEGLGRTDISALLVPYLESGRVQIIATTEPVSFHKFIESRADLMKGFEKIAITEPSTKEMIEILESILPSVEYKNRVIFLYPALKRIIEDADRFIKLTPFPEKAFDLLSEILAYTKSKRLSVITEQEVDEVITRKTNIPLGHIGLDERSKLLNLEAEMQKAIIGQDGAVRAIAQTMQRLRAGLTRRNKPAGVFLFIGPTGVGKTQTAKVLAKTYFGAESKMIRFDMSEYQDLESADRLLGSLRNNEPGRLASTVRDEPFSLILLDEIEKAHKNILNVFLQVFDEGNMTDVFGRKVNFEENIIIATSNAGAEFIRELVKEGIDPSLQKEKVIDLLVRDKYFSPEFLNRFDEIVIYHPLREEQLGDVTKILVDGLVERLRQKGYIFKLSDDVIKYITKIGYDPQFGARPMQRAIQDKLESLIARKILNQEIVKGGEFTLRVEELQ